MLFNSSEFLFLFLPLTLGVFLVLTRFSGARAAIAWLTLASGPIVQYHELLPQIERERWKSVRRINLETGLTIFAIGLFKKLVLADGSAEYANPFFDYMAAGGWVSKADAWSGCSPIRCNFTSTSPFIGSSRPHQVSSQKGSSPRVRLTRKPFKESPTN
jgi:hypothetical protein